MRDNQSLWGMTDSEILRGLDLAEATIRMLKLESLGWLEPKHQERGGQSNKRAPSQS